MEDYNNAEQRTLPLSECSAYEFMRRLSFWCDKNSFARVKREKMFIARANKEFNCRNKRRRNYWLHLEIKLQDAIMKKFRSCDGF